MTAQLERLAAAADQLRPHLETAGAGIGVHLTVAAPYVLLDRELDLGHLFVTVAGRRHDRAAMFTVHLSAVEDALENDALADLAALIAGHVNRQLVELETNRQMRPAVDTIDDLAAEADADVAGEGYLDHQEPHRQPYVGEGADGARRSAQIDAEEALQYEEGSERAHELEASSERWLRQAAQLEATQ